MRSTLCVKNWSSNFFCKPEESLQAIAHTLFVHFRLGIALSKRIIGIVQKKNELLEARTLSLEH